MEEASACSFAFPTSSPSLPSPLNFTLGRFLDLLPHTWVGREQKTTHKGIFFMFTPFLLTGSSWGREWCLLKMNEWRINLSSLWAPNHQGSSALEVGPPFLAIQTYWENTNRWLDCWMNTHTRTYTDILHNRLSTSDRQHFLAEDFCSVFHLRLLVWGRDDG